MKKAWMTFGLPLVLGLLANIPMIMFIEGWGPGISVATAVGAFGLAGILTGCFQRRFLWFSPILICLFSLVDPSTWDVSVFSLLIAPGDINEFNFYALLPLISLLSAFLGTWTGARLRPSPKTG